MDALRPIDADRSGVPLLEKRTGDPPGLPPAGTSRGRPYSGSVPGLLPASHTQESASASCTGADTRRRVGQTIRYSNDRRLGADRCQRTKSSFAYPGPALIAPGGSFPG